MPKVIITIISHNKSFKRNAAVRFLFLFRESGALSFGSHAHIQYVCVCLCLFELVWMYIVMSNACMGMVCVIIFVCVCDVCHPYVTQVKFSNSQGLEISLICCKHTVLFLCQHFCVHMYSVCIDLFIGL